MTRSKSSLHTVVEEVNEQPVSVAAVKALRVMLKFSMRRFKQTKVGPTLMKYRFPKSLFLKGDVASMLDVSERDVKLWFSGAKCSAFLTVRLRHWLHNYRGKGYEKLVALTPSQRPKSIVDNVSKVIDISTLMLLMAWKEIPKKDREQRPEFEAADVPKPTQEHASIASCSVCNMVESIMPNQTTSGGTHLVACSSCGIYAHRSCYGIGTVLGEKWRCMTCRTDEYTAGTLVW
jgi:hypothetical protein